MCDCKVIEKASWKGWVDMPEPRLSNSEAPWIEISHVLSENLDIIPTLPAPRIGRIRSMPEHIANITEVQMVCHFGTHVDAPCHFIADGPAIDGIALGRLYGQGVVWALDIEAFGEIQPEHFEAARPKLRNGDILLLDTGWWRRMGTPSYEDHPSIGRAAAEWLVAHSVKMVGVDFSTPELTAHLRPEGFDFPVHHTLLGNGVLVAEHLTNLSGFANQRVDVMFMALNIRGSDGAPARAVARLAS